MKRFAAWLCALALLLAAAAMPTAAEGVTCVYVTDFVYSRIDAIGVDDTILYNAYEADGSYVTGILSAQGEQTRVPFTFATWDELVEDAAWKKTVHGDAGALCPYADTHVEETVCPYLQVVLVTLTNTQTGVTLENYYVPSEAAVLLGDTAHFCWGRYGYESPVTLRWDGESRYMALQNAEGLWGAFDTLHGEMVTEYTYAAMSAFSGHYAKVSDGTAWGRLDLSGIYETAYCYESEDAFSITEEVRELSDGTWQVFDYDNAAISGVFDNAWTTVSYSADAHLLLVTEADGTMALYGLDGTKVAAFAATDEVAHLQEACYKAERYPDENTYEGAALVRVDGVENPYASGTMGDIDLSGEAESYDARLMLRAITGAFDLTDKQATVADINGDAAVDSADVRALLRTLIN